MKYAIAIPLEEKFLWEARVQLANFEKMKIPGKDVFYAIMMAGNEEKLMPKFDALVNEFPEVNIRLYSDFRPDEYRHTYPPTCRPHVMKQLLGEFPELAATGLFYTDSDVLFLKPPKFDDLSYTDTWFGSDVSSYVGAAYIIGRGNPYLLADMCGIVGVDYNVVKEKSADKVIGAHIIMKNADEAFWAEVEENSYKLYVYMDATTPYWEALYKQAQSFKKEKDRPYNPIQKWTADMWAVLWGAWKRGYNTIANEDMDFLHATDMYDTKGVHTIFHNNGIVKGSEDAKTKFCKQDFIGTTPFETNFNYVDRTSASFHYVEAIREYMKRKNNTVKLKAI